ncbi:hypothetical protein [uncultured Psychrobacter sp.]|uniref:hypothetical protein n=1 Tax=uncultured Psychrobacter sp. TaxID=259303 RepID=UPI002598DE0D|nr:hypothetical protein [uncultured Psychrobacter sp.]
MSNHNYPIKPSLINAWSARLAEQVPFCPCPPETVPVLDAVDGDIPFCELCELPQLDISGAAGVCQCTNFCLCCDQCTADAELDKNDGYCDECEAMTNSVVNGSQLPSNLE